MTPLSVLIVVLLVTLLVGHSIFIYRYARYSPWRATWQGIILMSQTITLALLVLFFIIDTAIVGDWPSRAFLLVLFLSLLAVESLVAALCLIYVQRQHTPVTPRQGTGFVHPDNIEGE